MKRIILLRFHKNFPQVQNRIDILKYFNPTLSIYGLYGGDKKDFDNARHLLKGLEDLTYLDIDDPEIKWRFSDLGILEWYKATGKEINFDIVHTIEYDLLLLEDLTKIYKYHEGDSHIYITNLTELDKVIPESNWFQNPKFPIEECRQFVDLMKSKYGIKKLYNSKAPGATLTKDYLEGYSKLNLPLLGFDEIRLPAIAQILGIEFRDTFFSPDWFDETSIYFLLFNTDNVEVKKEDLLKAYKSGFKVAFHPVYDIIQISEFGK